MNPITCEQICSALSPMFKPLGFSRKRNSFSRTVGDIDQLVRLEKHLRIEDSFGVRWYALLTHVGGTELVGITFGVPDDANFITAGRSLDNILDYERNWIPSHLLPVLRYATDLERIVAIPPEILKRHTHAQKYTRTAVETPSTGI